MDRYYDNSLMPIHIINVCLNRTSDPGEQLVQRDRKGKPLAVLPSGFVVDGKLVQVQARSAAANWMLN